MKKLFLGYVFAVLAFFGVISPASAAVDVSAVVAEVTAAVTPVGLIGGAVLLIFVTAAVYKWVRKAL